MFGVKKIKTAFIFLIPLLIIFSIQGEARSPSIRTLYQQATKYYNEGKYEKAIPLYEQIIDINPNFAQAFNQLGLSYKATGMDLKEVAWYFKAAIDINPKFAQAYENLGKAYYGLQDFDKAEYYCKKALEINPRLLSSAFSLGWIYLLGKSEPAKAILYFQRVAKEAHVPNAYFGLGLAYFMNNERAKVLEVITALRMMKQDDLASQLETVIRGRQYIPPPAGIPLITNDTGSKLIRAGTPKTTKKKEGESEEQKVQGMMKIRLRGKIVNLPPEEKKEESIKGSHQKTEEERQRELEKYRETLKY